MAAVSRSGQTYVLLGGGSTSVAALAVAGWLARSTEGFNIMGWYADYILPIGALLVGIAAGSGYGIASWMRGVKITRGLLAAVVGLQCATYAGAQYDEYRTIAPTYEDGTPVPFATYYDFATRNIAFTDGPSDKTPGKPLGGLGYGIRALEILGFVFGGVIAPIALKGKPYCDRCGVYMKTRGISLVPAGVVPRKFKKSEHEASAAHGKEAEEAFAKGTDEAKAILAAAAAGRMEEARTRCDASPIRKETHKLTARVAFDLSRCPTCRDGLLHARLLTGQGKDQKIHPLGTVPLEAEKARALRAD